MNPDILAKLLELIRSTRQTATEAQPAIVDNLPPQSPLPRGMRLHTGLAPFSFHTICIHEPRPYSQYASRPTFTSSAQSQRPLLVSPGVVFQPKPSSEAAIPPSQPRRKK